MSDCFFIVGCSWQNSTPFRKASFCFHAYVKNPFLHFRLEIYHSCINLKHALLGSLLTKSLPFRMIHFQIQYIGGARCHFLSLFYCLIRHLLFLFSIKKVYKTFALPMSFSKLLIKMGVFCWHLTPPLEKFDTKFPLLIPVRKVIL